MTKQRYLLAGRALCFGIRLNPRFWAAVAISSMLLTALGQNFSDLDFEGIGASSIPSDGIWLGWSLAAPGWQHAEGGDSVFVYHHNPPQASIAQYYFLVDSSSTLWSPLAGNYSLALVSGHFNRYDPNSPWVNASISEQGVIPSDAKSFHMLAAGDFTLSIDSSVIPMTSMGGDLYSGDISAFDGQFATVQIENDSMQTQQPLIVDNLGFSPQPVPEPSSVGLISLGLGALALGLRRRVQSTLD